MKSIAEIARQYIGIKEVNGNNVSFSDKKFESKLKSLGWISKWAYCSFFAQLCIEEYLSQFDSTLIVDSRRLFNPMAIIMYRQYKIQGMTSFSPTSNCLCAWQNIISGKEQMTGHIAVHVKTENGYVTTIDGNTNIAGSREGDGMMEKTRLININPTNGLKFLGYIILPDYDN